MALPKYFIRKKEIRPKATMEEPKWPSSLFSCAKVKKSVPNLNDSIAIFVTACKVFLQLYF